MDGKDPDADFLGFPVHGEPAKGGYPTHAINCAQSSTFKQLIVERENAEMQRDNQPDSNDSYPE
jgi:hypothetical protein